MEFDIQPLIIKLIVVLIIVLPYLYHLIFVFEQSKIINNAIKCSKLKYIIEKNTLRYSLYKFNTNINHEIFNILAFISILSLSILLYYMYDNRFLYAIIFNILLFLLIFLPNINKSKNTSELNDYIHLLYTINKLLKDNEIPEKLKKIIKRNIGIIHECTNVYDINVIYNNTTEYTQYISIDITNDDYSYVKNTIANFIDINNKDDFQEKIDDFKEKMDFCSKTLHHYTINTLLKDNEIPEKLEKIIKDNIGIIHESTNDDDINVIYNDTTEYTKYIISIDITNDDYSYVKNTIANFIVDSNNKDDFLLKMDDFKEKTDFCSKTFHLDTINTLLKDNEIPEKLKKIIKDNIRIMHETTNEDDINKIYNDTTEYTKYISIDITNDDYSYVKNTIANFIVDSNNKDDFQEKIDDFKEKMDFCSKTLHLDFKNNTNTNTIALVYSNSLLYGLNWGEWFYSYHFITALFIGIIYILLDIYDDKIYVISFYILFYTIMYIFLAFFMIKGNQLLMLSHIPLLIIILLM
jgi:hypothetical protein